eukprot:399545_1
MYSLTNNNEIINNIKNGDEIYTVLVNENGNKLFDDMFIGYESNNTLTHGQIIELNKEISETETYILITFSIFNGISEILVGIIYYIDIFSPIFDGISDMIELNTFTKNGIKPNYQCINYNKLNDIIIIGWVNNYHEFAYKPFYFNSPSNNNNNNNDNNNNNNNSVLITTESPISAISPQFYN